MTDDSGFEPDPQDPVERLLREAFAADRAGHPAAPVADRVMARIRAERRLRGLVLGAATLLGATLAGLSIAPALAALLTPLETALRSGVPGDWGGSAMVLAALAVLAGGFLILQEEEPL